jgi:hypothetical protein
VPLSAEEELVIAKTEWAESREGVFAGEVHYG